MMWIFLYAYMCHQQVKGYRSSLALKVFIWSWCNFQCENSYWSRWRCFNLGEPATCSWSGVFNLPGLALVRIISTGPTTLLRCWINVIDVDSTSQQRRVPSAYTLRCLRPTACVCHCGKEVHTPSWRKKRVVNIIEVVFMSMDKGKLRESSPHR